MPIQQGHSILRLAVVAGALGFILPGKMHGDVIFQVTVDTHTINGTPGFLEFGFAPGNDSQAALISIGLFSPGGALTGAPSLNGGVSGTLPGAMTIDNSTAFNDYFQGFNYGNTIGFRLSFGGPAITAPNGTASSGSTFGFGIFDSTGNNPLLTSDPNGNLFTVDVNLDGSTTLHNFSSNAQVAAISTAPEPASSFLLAFALAGIVVTKARGEL